MQKKDFLTRLWRFVWREYSSKNPKKPLIKNKSNDADKAGHIKDRSTMAYALLASPIDLKA